MSRIFHACLAPVPDRGHPPAMFLNELLDAIIPLPDALFAPNDRRDIFSVVAPILGPWSSLQHRKAAMCEVLRVLGGLESSWHWNEGVDTTNHTSMHNPLGEETGIFQVSADSMAFDPSLRLFIVDKLGSDHPSVFIPAMKSDHALAVEYGVRLLRVSVQWDGPIRRGELSAAVSRSAVAEFQAFLAGA